MNRTARVLIVAACVAIFTAQILAADEPNQSPTRVFTLHATRAPGLRIELPWDFKRSLIPFEKEPATEGKQIARNWIPTEPPTPLLRNITDRQLHVKADHNPDFSQGSLVTYSSRQADVAHIRFESIRVFSLQGSMAIPYTVDLYTYRRGLGGWLCVRSGWSAPFEWSGKPWHLTIIDNLDGRIDGQDRLILRSAGPADEPPLRFECAAPETLFLDGQAFRLDFAYRQIETEVVLEATATELQLAMGELNVEAKGCQSLALRDDRLTVLLDNPGGAVPVPAGRYRVDNCILDEGPNQELAPTFSESGPEVCVEAGSAETLRLGLPLTNSIAATRDRNLLAFKYRLVGIGGESYDYLNPTAPPGFRIYKGPVRLGQGSFGVG